MKWEIINKSKVKSQKSKVEEIVEILLENRGMKTEKQIEEFLNPPSPEKLTVKDLGLDQKQLDKAIKRIKKAIDNEERIIVYGDYDADGICATAILWETLYKLNKKVMPYIPERVNEGYGLNKKSISALKEKNSDLKLIITVDHGVTANEKIKYAESLGVDVIVCDHHQLGKEKPKCLAVVHTDKVCAAAIAWYLSQEIQKSENCRLKADDFLDLVAIATIADMEPLLGVNRSLAKYGLEALNKTKRCGLLAIFEEAGIKQGEIKPYEVGFIIAPRLNAMGRMEHALESLRLVCTSKAEQAKDLAIKLGLTNKERQLLTQETAKHARALFLAQEKEGHLPNLAFISHESYQEGVIGLAAGKITEEFYRPAIVVAKGEVYSKASARSINGFNIIEVIRAQSDLLVDAGGHPMAAGFTIETVKLEEIKSRLLELAQKELDGGKLTKTLKIDCEIPLEKVTFKLYEQTRAFAPFGIGNPEPVFASRQMKVFDARVIGSEGKHLKLRVAANQPPTTNHPARHASPAGQGLPARLPSEARRSGTLSGRQDEAGRQPLIFNAIAFGLGYLLPSLSIDQPVDIAYNLQLNQWNGKEDLELKLKDLKWKKD